MDSHVLLKFLSNKKKFSLSSMYKNLSISTPKDKTAAKQILRNLERQGALTIKDGRFVEVLDHKKVKAHTVDSPTAKTSKTPIRIVESEDDHRFIMERYSLPKHFSKKILNEVAHKSADNDQDSTRKDLRKDFIVTIDGADSKDLDDAVSIRKSFFGDWILGVHIADVSHYVERGSATDKEAYSRANSYYLVNKVIPMLPEQLSNDLCSLNPNEDKRCMSIFLTINAKGDLKDYKIVSSWIRSKHRLTYDFVNDVLLGKTKCDGRLKKTLFQMDKLFRILNKKRINKGSVDFNFREKKIQLDDQSKPVNFYQKDRLDSERLIEEFMLMANTAAADFLTKKGLGLYRVHDSPPPEKYQRLRTFAAKYGSILPESPDSKQIQDFLNLMFDSPVLASAETFVLRSMAQAVYHPTNKGHFGLAFDLYTHFTSPIRRYADLVVHRLIKHFLVSDHTRSPYRSGKLDEIALHISAQERVAMEAERDFFKIKAVRYLKQFEGCEFDGKISSVTSFGLFVEMESGIEAMVRYQDIPGYFVFDEETLSAKSRQKTYRLGDPCRVLIEKVNTERAMIDAVFVNS